MKRLPPFRNARRSNTSARSTRLPFLESLERRSVLSVCGLSCALVDGTLRVDGTSGDDLIAVRYDAASSLVHVVGANDELVAQVPLSDIRHLSVHGLEGNDQFSVDSSLAIPVTLNGGEGEDALVGGAASSAHSHRHGSSPTSSVIQSSIERTVAQLTLPTAGPVPSLVEPAQTLAPSVPTTAQFDSSTAASTTSSFTAVNTAFQIADHGSHAQQPALQFTGTHLHDGSAGLVAATTPAGLMLHGHGQAVSLASHSASPTEPPSVVSYHDELAFQTHEDNHEKPINSVEPSSKLVPKPCTVSQTGGLIVTSADGKRQCGCEGKKLAAEEATRQIMGEGEAPLAKGLITSVAECLPCQSSDLFANLPSGLLACSLPPALQSPTLLLEQISDSECPARSQLAVDEVVANEAPWLGGLPIVGFSLLAASIAVVPSLRKRKDTPEHDEPRPPGADWLFGRFNLELLMAR